MDKKLKTIHVVGARPNFMKVAPILREMSRYRERFENLLVHTGQHYDAAMSDVFFEELGMPPPDVYLGVGSGRHGEQTAKVLAAFEGVLVERNPDLVLVVGDVNSTLACALAAAKVGIRVAHVEAGLRSFDRTMPEEINRVLTDQISDFLFVTEDSAVENLQREGIDRERIHFVGNVMIDSLIEMLPIARRRWNDLVGAHGLRFDDDGRPRFVLATFHRPSNVDDPATLREVMRALSELADSFQVLFPVHPRTRSRIEALDGFRQADGVELISPLGYLDFLALMERAAVVLTDSGGIQEETTYLGVPCVTVRPNTERPVTVTRGTNRLVSSTTEAILIGVKDALEAPARPDHPPLWDGRAAERITQVLLDQA